MTDSEIISSFIICTRAVCCTNCKLKGKPDCITELNEMVIGLLKRHKAAINRTDEVNKVKRKMARNEGKRMIAKKG